VSATERVEFQPAFVLHVRAWRETSGIVELLTGDHGRVGLVARGMRRPRGALRSLLQPFHPVAVSWSGRGGGLMNLRAAESMGPAVSLQGAALMSAFYLNELLLRFLHHADPHPQLFAAYGAALAGLARDAGPEPVLRRFELNLLSETGYGLNLDHDAVTGAPLDPDGRYRYVLDQGPVASDALAKDEPLFAGADLLAIGQGDFAGAERLHCARRLLRAVLDHALSAGACCDPLRDARGQCDHAAFAAHGSET
jgi:DNA repair protein RecO (recombination protein O)